MSILPLVASAAAAGAIFSPGGALACWDNLRSRTDDGPEAADFLGAPEPINTESFEDTGGSVNPQCFYRSPGHGHTVTSELPLPRLRENETVVCDLGVNAECHTNPHGTQDRPYTELVVLLDDYRLYKPRLGRRALRHIETVRRGGD